MTIILAIERLGKTYDNGFVALKGVDLTIRRGEIFALLGPNGAGKTTLIGIVCGLLRASAGKVTVDGCDIASEYRKARRKIGLVPQELSTNQFETVWDAVCFSRGLFGLAPDPAHLERVLRDLSGHADEVKQFERLLAAEKSVVVAGHDLPARQVLILRGRLL